jgi:hypothetical protein
MKKFHICYLLAAELCSGVNISAKNYIDAVQKFTVLHGNKEILYVSAMAA